MYNFLRVWCLKYERFIISIVGLKFCFTGSEVNLIQYTFPFRFKLNTIQIILIIYLRVFVNLVNVQVNKEAFSLSFSLLLLIHAQAY